LVASWNNVIPDKGEILPIDKGRIIRSIGTRLHEALVTANEVEDSDPTLGITVADDRYMKPLDVDNVCQLADEHSVLYTVDEHLFLVRVEEGSIGSVGDHALHFLSFDACWTMASSNADPWSSPTPISSPQHSLSSTNRLEITPFISEERFCDSPSG
jgi:deoxyxylulose-5-phosphate synthase